MTYTSTTSLGMSGFEWRLLVGPLQDVAIKQFHYPVAKVNYGCLEESMQVLPSHSSTITEICGCFTCPQKNGKK